MAVRGQTKNVALAANAQKDLEGIETFIPQHIDLRNGHLTPQLNWEKRPGLFLQWQVFGEMGEVVVPPPDEEPPPPEPPPEEEVCETAHIHVPTNVFSEGTGLRGEDGVVFGVGNETGTDALIVYRFLMQTNELAQTVVYTDGLLSSVHSVDIDSHGVIYMMINSVVVGGSNRLARLNMTTLLEAASTTITLSIAGLAVDKYQDDLVWVFNSGGGLHQVHGYNKSNLTLAFSTSNLGVNIIYLCGDGDGNCWIVTDNAGDYTLRKIEPDGDLGTTKNLGVLESPPMITYDLENNAFIIGTISKIRKYDIATDTVSVSTFTSGGTILIRDGTFKNHPIDGEFWVVENNNFTMITLSTMATTHQIPITNFVGHDDTLAYAAVFQLPLDDSIVTTLADAGHVPQGIDHICLDDIDGIPDADDPIADPPDDEPDETPPEPEEPPSELPGAGLTRYASPTGGGNGQAVGTPYLISDFWAEATPGSTLNLADGTYTGASSMLTPTQNLSGTSSNRITIQATNEGNVFINGQDARGPCVLDGNKFLTIIGINFGNSNTSVVHLKNHASDNIFQRCIAWNANETTNSAVWAIHAEDNLVEDCAGFGTGRIIFTSSQGGDNLILRRCWGMFEASTKTGPKQVFNMSYNTEGEIYENCVGTWNEAEMGGASLDQPYGIFSTIGPSSGSDYAVNGRYLGCLAYLRSADECDSWLGGIFGSRACDFLTFKDCVSYIEPGSHTSLRPILGQIFDGGSGVGATASGGNRIISHCTAIGTGSSSISTHATNGWTIANHASGNTVSNVPSVWGSVGQGARLRFRYVDGTITGTALWPWPMDARIRAALTTAGKAPNTIFGGVGATLTTLVESIFGDNPDT